MDEGKLILSEGLDIADEPVTDETTLPFVALRVVSIDDNVAMLRCCLSSLAGTSLSVSELSIRSGLLLYKELQEGRVKELSLVTPMFSVGFDVKSDVYISVMGSTCLFSLSEPRAE